MTVYLSCCRCHMTLLYTGSSKIVSISEHYSDQSAMIYFNKVKCIKFSNQNVLPYQNFDFIIFRISKVLMLPALCKYKSILVGQKHHAVELYVSTAVLSEASYC